MESKEYLTIKVHSFQVKGMIVGSLNEFECILPHDHNGVRLRAQQALD